MFLITLITIQYKMIDQCYSNIFLTSHQVDNFKKYKETLLTDMEIIYSDKCGDVDILFCRLLKDIFKFEKDSFIVMEFENSNYIKNDEFKFKYINDMKNKELTYELFKAIVGKKDAIYKELKTTLITILKSDGVL